MALNLRASRPPRQCRSAISVGNSAPPFITRSTRNSDYRMHAAFVQKALTSPQSTIPVVANKTIPGA